MLNATRESVCAIAISIALASCASPEQLKAEQDARAEARRAFVARMVLKYGPRCEAAGKPRGTTAYDDCIIAYTNEEIRKEIRKTDGSGTGAPYPVPPTAPMLPTGPR